MRSPRKVMTTKEQDRNLRVLLYKFKPPFPSAGRSGPVGPSVDERRAVCSADAGL
jgi:hypothetical protein